MHKIGGRETNKNKINAKCQQTMNAAVENHKFKNINHVSVEQKNNEPTIYS